MPALPDLAVGELAYAVRLLRVSDQRHLVVSASALVAAVADTSVAVDSLAVAEDTGRVAVVAVGTDRDRRAVEEADRTRHRAVRPAADSGRAKRCAQERKPVSGLKQE